MGSITQEVISRARRDLAQRLGVGESEIGEPAVEESEFPDAALGASAEDEMSAQLITPGWRIRFNAAGRDFEYRANERQLRLFNFNGENYRI